MSLTGRETALKLHDAVMQIYDHQQLIYYRDFVSVVSRRLTGTTVMDEWSHIKPKTFHAQRNRLNYTFGEALQDLKHPFATEYHKLGQAGKENERLAWQRKAESPAAAMAKYRPVWNKYLELTKLAELTRKLEDC